MISIRKLQEQDWPHVWQFMEPVIRVGQTYPFALDMDSEQAHNMWIEVTECAYVAVDEAGNIIGSYYIKPNQPTLGAHSLTEAVKLGYRAMQFNLVVATNEASVHVWKKLGFHVVGTLPGAFSHKDLGYVDAYVFYKVLI